MSETKESPNGQDMAQREEEAVASALTTLVDVASGKVEEEDEEEDEDFEIPQRFTKSGRKRAVPFPLKVRLHVRVFRMCDFEILAAGLLYFSSSVPVNESPLHQGIQ
jgi:hypothetical protein